MEIVFKVHRSHSFEEGGSLHSDVINELFSVKIPDLVHRCVVLTHVRPYEPADMRKSVSSRLSAFEVNDSFTFHRVYVYCFYYSRTRFIVSSV